MGRTAVGTQLTIAEELIVAAIENDTYFVWIETPTGLINGANTEFTLSRIPNPTSSLRVFVNGVRQTLTTEFTSAGVIVTLVTAPPTLSTVRTGYTVDPN